ncbi:MAG: FG-GAP-like repeat-containing protein [Deltaproteobacteria bacterium]|nr:FG-GAP-like repeat-containing protein [Deltaproteobacteria bacterium]
MGDFNSDGNYDIAVSDSAYSSSDIHILIGDGKGSFNTGKIFKMSVSQPGKIVAADFDEDGIIDLAVHSISSSSIWLLTGNGDATFTEMSLIYAPNDFIVNDFNRDGNLDIMSFKFGSRKALVYSGDGNKDFKLTHEFTYPMSYTPEKWLPIVKDLNDDGDLDLLINARDSLMTFHGQGDGTFQKGFSFGGYKSANGLEVSDFNHDGIVDIAIASEKRFSIIPGKGNGLFQGEALINIDGLHSGISMITGDFNNDHNQDIAFSAYPSEWYSTPKDTTKIFFYWGSGHNTFKSGPVIETSTNYGGRLYGSDFNGDGNTDIAYLEHGWSGNNVLVYLAKGDGIFSEAIPYEIEDHRSSIQLGDVNGDGYTDIINNAEINTTWGNSSYSVNIHAGNGDGTFHFHQAIPLGEYPWDRHLSSIPGDFNNDGYNDLVTRESNSLTDYYNMKIFLNKGDGTFGSIAVYEINLRRSGKLYVKDLDLDGNLDIALVSSVITHFRGNGDGTFNAGVDYARDASGLNVVFKDFNLDGLPDIASSSGHDARAYLDLIYHLKKPLANPLSPPKGLKGVVDDSSASLVWAENSEADLKGYNIYRSLSPGGGYEKLNATLVSSASYKDTGLTNGLTYYYTVSAVNNNDEESSFAVKVGVMPIPPDTEAPNFNIITPAESEPVITPYLFVSGTIDDPDAKISVNGIAGTIHKQDGVFTVYDIPLNIGENTLTVVAVDLMGNVSEKTAKVIYTPTAIVSGTVKSEDSGLAVSYAYVQIRDTEKTQYLWTGTDGRYRFNKIVPGEIYIKAHGSNYGTVNITRTVSPGEELLFDISLPLYPAAIRAWIYDSYNYSSIGNATVTIEDPKKTQTLTSNDSGYFETYNVAPFQATITISKDGYETYSKVHTLTNQWTNYLYFYLDTLPPSAPVGVAASDAMEGVIQLTWSANSEGNLVGYRIYRSLTAGSGYQFIGSTNASTISFTDSDVEIGTNYYYVVTANNSSSQESGNSVEVSASPKELPVPAGLSATPGEGEVKLAWSSSPGNGLSSYNIYRSELSATDYTLIDSVSSSYLSYTDVDVEAGITYYYVVTAVNAWSKESGWSNEASAIPEEVLLRVNITSPIEGSFLDSSHTIVTGTAKSISPEVGVIIIVEAQTERETLTRSYLAHFNDGDFAAEVNLFPAAFNTIKAIATIPSGETDESSKTVYAGGTINVATLDASPSSGIIYTSTGNLDIEFEVDYKGSGTPIAYSWDFNGDGVVDSVTSTPGPVTFGYSGAGIYTPEVTVTVENSTGGGLPGPFGRDEVQTVKVATVVNVMNLEQTDAILKAVWSGMKEAMKAGDVNSILTFYHPSSREKYKRVFIALADQLSGIAVNMNDIEMDYIRNDVAEYRFSRLEEFNSSLIEITYFIYFVKDEDGLWRIESF